MAVALMSQEAAYRAPAMLAGAAPSNAAVTLANSVSTVALGGATKVAVAAAVAVVALAAGVWVGGSWWGGVAASGGATMPVAAATASEDDDIPGVAQEPMVAAFDLMMDAATAQKLRDAATVVQTQSELYAAYRTSNEAALEVLRKAMDGRELFDADDPNVKFDRWNEREGGLAQGLDRYLMTFQWKRGGDTLYAQSQLDGSARQERTAAGLRLDVDLKDASFSTWKSDGQPLNGKGALRFKGEIVPGETVFFVADAGSPAGQALAHVVVWQAFRVTAEQASQVGKIVTCKSWIARGPSGAKALANRSLVWQQRETKPLGATEGMRKMANGAEVRIVAVGKPVEYPFCWWKMDGTPIASDWTGRDTPLESEAGVVVEFRVPEFGRAGENDSDIYYGSGLSSAVRFSTKAHGEGAWRLRTLQDTVEVGIACGPWQDAGTLDGVGVFRSGDVTVRITKIYPLDINKGVMPATDVEAPADVEVRVQAVDRNGKVCHDIHELTAEVADKMPEIQVGKPGRRLQMAPNLWIPKDEVDHYVIQTRRREWVTFEGVPVKPTVEIPEKVTVAEVVAARAKAGGANAEGGGREVRVWAEVVGFASAYWPRRRRRRAWRVGAGNELASTHANWQEEASALSHDSFRVAR